MPGDSLTIATHDGKFHPDDVLAVAILTTIYPRHQIVRSRDLDVLDLMDIVLDVGGIYDPESRRYDHHMNNPPCDKNGHMFSSAGLIWKHYSKSYLNAIKMPKEVKVGGDIYDLTALVEKEMRIRWIYPIDRADNGVSHSPTPIGEVVNIMRPIRPERSRGRYDALFLECVSMVTHLFQRACFKAADYAIDKLICHRDPKSYLCDGKVAVSQTPIGNYRMFNNTDVQFVISPVQEYIGEDPYFVIRALMSMVDDARVYKTGFPESWWGMHRDSLYDATLITGLKYCHHTGFLILTDTQEAAVALCEHVLTL